MKIIAALVITLIVTTSCTYRYDRPGATTAVLAADLRECHYEAYRADRWGDDKLMDECMVRKTYVIQSANSITYVWTDGMRESFRDYDRRKAAQS